MRKNEVTKMVEQVIRTEYIAEDGTVFFNEAECIRYEQSAWFAVSRELKRLNTFDLTQENFFLHGDCDQRVEVFDIQTEKDLENLKRYVYLTLCESCTEEAEIKHFFERKDFGIDHITYGHEVIICWGYEDYGVWTYLDGSIDGYFTYLRRNMEEKIKARES